MRNGSMMVFIGLIMRIENPKGNYSFLKGISPYSAGVVASRDFEIEHARFQRALPLRTGFAAVDRHLNARELPRQSLVRIELRPPRAVTCQGCTDFSAAYVHL